MNNKLWLDLERQRRNAEHARQQRAARSHRHRGSSYLKYARRPEGWREWLAALLLKRVFKHQSKPLPVALRPWVPANWYRWTEKEYRAALKAADIPGHQWPALIAQLKPVTPAWLAEQEARWIEREKRTQFDQWQREQYAKREAVKS